VTREGVKVDRMASAWLIRRFIDPAARFRTVPSRGVRPAEDELGFDLYEGGFTHEGDRCTFEVLCAAFGLSDPALLGIGEIVHDIDLKDGKFGRDETAGVAALVKGLALTHAADEARLAAGATLFEALYRQLSAETR
jgi:hypothetical protein